MNFRTDLTKTLIGWLSTGMCGLFVFCLVTIYRSYEDLMFSGNDLLLQQENDAKQLHVFGEFFNETRPVLERSANRALQIEKVSHYKKDDLVDAAAQRTWHLTSSQAMITASRDLAGLDRFSSATVPLATAYLDSLRRVLNSELDLWRQTDSYIDAKAREPRDTNREEQGFQAFTQALLTYSTAIASAGSAAKQTGDRLQLSKDDAETNFLRQMNARDRERRHFRLAYLGAIFSFLVISIGLTLIAYPRLKRLHSVRRAGSKEKKTSRSRKK